MGPSQAGSPQWIRAGSASRQGNILQDVSWRQKMCSVPCQRALSGVCPERRVQAVLPEHQGGNKEVVVPCLGPICKSRNLPGLGVSANQ